MITLIVDSADDQGTALASIEGKSENTEGRTGAQLLVDLEARFDLALAEQQGQGGPDR